MERVKVRRRLAVIVLIIAFSYGAYYWLSLLTTGIGYKAKMLCSDVWVSGKSPELALQTPIPAYDNFLLRWIDVKFEPEKALVKAQFLTQLSERRVVFDKKYGCTLLPIDYKTPSLPPVFPFKQEIAKQSKTERFSQRFNPAIRWATAAEQHTQAVLIRHQGKIVAEYYAEGTSPSTPLLTWSVSKSMMNTLVGMLAQQGKINLEEAIGGLPNNVSYHHLLQMQSGLVFDEDYDNPRSDVLRMLYKQTDMGGFAASTGVAFPAGEHWEYASGTSNLISKMVRQNLSDAAYEEVFHHQLFTPLNMRSAVFERDASGNFVGSSYFYASARDLSLWGQLYLQDGVWQGVRILPQNWVDYTATAAEHSQGQYGAHFWLKLPEEYQQFDLPEGGFHAVGHDGQFVSIIPSLQFVIVRLGAAPANDNRRFEQGAFIQQVISAVEQ